MDEYSIGNDGNGTITTKRQTTMKEYSITSERYKGEVIAKYNDKGWLLNLDVTQAELTESQHAWFLNNCPKTEQCFDEWRKQERVLHITLIPEREITFEAFWQRYDDKINSSKKRTKAKWDKMSKSEQVKAYNYINRYFSNIPYGTRKKYAETYLNAEVWNN